MLTDANHGPTVLLFACVMSTALIPTLQIRKWYQNEIKGFSQVHPKLCSL